MSPNTSVCFVAVDMNIYIFMQIGYCQASSMDIMVSQFPGGWLAPKFGGKYVFGVGVLVTSLLTLITPQMANLNIWALVACRVIMGAFEAREIQAKMQAVTF